KTRCLRLLRDAVDEEREDAGRELRGDGVGPGQGVDVEPVSRELGAAGDRNRRGQSGDLRRAVSARDDDVVGAVGAGDGDVVGGTVAGVGGGRVGEVDRDGLGDGAGEVADGDVVDAAEDAEVDVFDAAEVGGDGGDVAGDASAGAVGGDRDVLGDVG